MIRLFVRPGSPVRAADLFFRSPPYPDLDQCLKDNDQRCKENEEDDPQQLLVEVKRPGECLPTVGEKGDERCAHSLAPDLQWPHEFTVSKHRIDICDERHWRNTVFGESGAI